MIFVEALLFLVGLTALTLGADWLVTGSSRVAEQRGVSPVLVGLTIVALGTSLPEMATSAVAGLRGERDIAVGNAVGSNIFNLLAVLGVTAVVAPGGIPVSAAAINIDIPIMIAVAVACIPVFFDGFVIYRWNGALFVSLYAAYIVHLVMQGTEHAAAGRFSNFMLVFVIPLAASTLIITAVQTWRRR